MHQQCEFERIRTVLEAHDEPLTAQEIREQLADRGEECSSHRIATVLGRWAETGAVDVIQSQPYRYRVRSD